MEANHRPTKEGERAHLFPSGHALIPLHVAAEPFGHRRDRQLLPQHVQRLRRVLLPPRRLGLPPQLLLQSLPSAGREASAPSLRRITLISQ
jgi:hypothetical protein